MPQSAPLILEIFKQDLSLKMGLFSQAQTAPTLRHYSQVGVSFSELEQLSLEMVNTLNLPAKDQVSKLQQLKSLQKTGQLLWDHLFSRPVKARLKESQVCGLTLSLDEELIYIPWELIFDGKDFLGLKFSLGRLVRSREDPSFLQYRDLAESLKMLVLADPNADLKSAYTEGLNIKNQFTHKTRKVQVDFKSTHIDRHYVKKNICDYDIVHFAGHCEFDKSEINNSGWVLSDGVFRIGDILKMGQSGSLPALVFSNACHSAEVCNSKSYGAKHAPSSALINLEYQRANYGMASAFLFAGVRHYIGSIRKIEDNASQIFAREFYAKLISGVSVGESLRLSRLKLIREKGLASLDWVNYLLYGDPGFVFFRIPNNRRVKPKITLYHKRMMLTAGLILVSICLGVFLVFWLPRINPTKYYLYFNALSSFRHGNNQEAVALGQRVIDKDRDFLMVYPIVASGYWNLGDKEKALKYYYEYMLKSEKLGDKKNLLQAYIKLGWFYQLDGQYAKAQELYNQAVELSRKLKDRQNEAVALRKLAVWNIDRANYELAMDLLTKSVAINSEYPGDYEHLKNLACDYFDLGLIYSNKNDYEAAKEFYLKSQKIFQRLKLNNELSDCYYNLGEIYLFQKQYQKALDYYFEGLNLDQRHDNKINLASGYNMIGELYLEMDNLGQAQVYLSKSAQLSEKIDSRQDLASANYNLGVLYKRKGKKALAREHWRKAQEIYSVIDPDKQRQIGKELQNLEVD